MFLLDAIGRRPLMIGGITLQCIFMFLIGGVGSITGDAATVYSANATVVACVILFASSYSLGWATGNWVTVAEISDQKLRDKNQRVGAWTNIVSKWVRNI